MAAWQPQFEAPSLYRCPPSAVLQNAITNSATYFRSLNAFLTHLVRFALKTIHSSSRQFESLIFFSVFFLVSKSLKQLTEKNIAFYIVLILKRF